MDFKRFFRVAFRFIRIFLVVSVVTVILYRFIPVPITPFMIQSLVEQMVDPNRTVRLEKDWEPMKNISPNLQLAAICAEDQNFYNHYGFDFDAIKRAMQYNKTHKKKRGASTITQQTAKNTFLLSYRNYLRKALEAYFTVLIEVFWSKDRILEVYLNVIEYGDGIYGAEAASQHFFKKSAKDLSRSEAALLIAVLPNPKIFLVDKPSKYTRKRQRLIERKMTKNSLKNFREN